MPPTTNSLQQQPSWMVDAERLRRMTLGQRRALPGANLSDVFKTPEMRKVAVEMGILDAGPPTLTVEESSEASRRLLEASINELALNDELFRDAPTDVSKLRRLNQIRRRFDDPDLPPLDELPDALKPVGPIEELGKQFTSPRALVEKVPFAGEIATMAVDLATILPAANRVREGKETEEDLEVLADAAERAVEAQRPRTKLGTAARVAAQIPTYGVEFFATGGAGTIARKAAVKTAAKVAGKAIADVVEKTLKRRGIKGLTDVAAQVAAFEAIKIVPQAAKRTMPEIRDLGKQELVVFEGEKTLTALKNAGFDIAVEITSERAGVPIAAIGRFGGGLLGKAIRKVLPSTKGLGKKVPKLSLTARSFLDRVGYQGPITEELEELGGRFVRQAATDAGFVELPQEELSADQIIGEMLAFSLPVAGGFAADVRSRRREGLQPEGVEEVGPDAAAEKLRKEEEITTKAKAMQRKGLSAKAARARAEKEVLPEVKAPPVEQVQVERVEPEVSRQATVEEVMQREVSAGRVVPEPESQEPGTEIVAFVPRSLRAMGPSKTPRKDFLPPEVRERQEAARGRKERPLKERVAAYARIAWGKATRPQEFLPELALKDLDKWASAKEAFQRFRTIAGRATHRGVLHVTEETEGLPPDDYGLFRDYLNARNQLSALDHPSKSGDPQPLRHGWENRAQVVTSTKKMQEEIANRPAIINALEVRGKLNNVIVQRLVKFDMLSEATLENVEDYVHQEIATLGAAGPVAGGANTARAIKRAWQHGRITGPERLGPEYDWNTEFLETETKWVTQAYVELEKRETFDEFIRKPYDIYDRLITEAKASREAGENVEWSDLIPDDGSLDGHVVWYPTLKNVLYKAFSIPEKIAQAIQVNEFEGELTPEQVKVVVALGGRHKPVVIPRRIAKQLDLLERKTTDALALQLQRASMSEWKRWTRLGPHRILGAQLRDFTGNFEAVLISGPPKTLAEVPGAIKELIGFYRGEVVMGVELAAAFKNGVLPSSFEATDVPSVDDVRLFQRFFTRAADPKGVPLRLWKAYFDAAGKYAAFQDAVFRYSVFRAARKALPEGLIKTYSGTHRATINSLYQDHGVDVAAAKLARDNIGDYSNVTVLSNWLRVNALPFWSWPDTVFRRMPRFTLNAVLAKDYRSTAKIPTVMLRAILTARLGSFYAVMWAWNNLVHGQKERELTTYDRMIPHIVLCRNDDGTVRTFRNIGLSGEFLEWFGINTLIALIPRIEDGTLTWGELAAETAKDPVNKVYQSVRFDMKAMWEVPTGTTMFPDTFNPRRVPRDELVAGYFGMQDFYRAAKGYLLENGQRARPHTIQRLIVGVVDERRNAMNEIYSLRDRFLSRLGREKGTFPRSEFATIRHALMNNDYEAYKEAMLIFARRKIDQGQDWGESYFLSVGRLDPIAATLNKELEEKFEQEFLNPIQRKRLMVAREYAQDLAILAKDWFRKIRKELRKMLRE